MIQIIFDYQDEVVLREIAIGTENNPSVFNLPVIVIPEMNNAYLTLIEPEKVTAFITALKKPPLRFTMIGSYNMDGSQYIWTAAGETSRNHSISRYKSMLRDKVEYDAEGVEISRRRPTTAEAKTTQVNKIAGYNDRQL